VASRKEREQPSSRQCDDRRLLAGLVADVVTDLDTDEVRRDGEQRTAMREERQALRSHVSGIPPVASNDSRAAPAFGVRDEDADQTTAVMIRPRQRSGESTLAHTRHHRFGCENEVRGPSAT
jgi:hypothetical protein